MEKVREILAGSCRIDPENPRRLLVKCKPLRYTGSEYVELYLLLKSNDIKKAEHLTPKGVTVPEHVRDLVNQRGTVTTPLWKNRVDYSYFQKKYEPYKKTA